MLSLFITCFFHSPQMQFSKVVKLVGAAGAIPSEGAGIKHFALADGRSGEHAGAAFSPIGKVFEIVAHSSLGRHLSGRISIRKQGMTPALINPQTTKCHEAHSYAYKNPICILMSAYLCC